MNFVMIRPKRINVPGCVCYVICPANRHDVIFEDDEDKKRFLEYLKVIGVGLHLEYH